MNAQSVLAQTALDFGVSVDEITSQNGRRLVMQAKRAVMRRLRSIPGDDGKPLYDASELGRVLGLDHSTVIYHLRQIEGGE